MRLRVRIAGRAEPTALEGVDSGTTVGQLRDMVCAAAKLPAVAEEGRKLVHRRSVLMSGTMAANGVEDGAWLVLLPSASAGAPSEPQHCAAPADAPAPTLPEIRAATASEESVAKEEKAIRDVLRLLSEFFQKPPSEEGEAEGGDEGVVSDDEGVQQLQEMGFSENRARRALLLNSGASAAMEWLLQDLDDATLDNPLTEEEMAAITKQRSAFMPEPQLVHQLVEMGFELGKVLLALRASNNREDRALVWLFSEAEAPHETSDSDAAMCALGAMLSRPGVSSANRKILQALATLAQGDCEPETLMEDPVLAPSLRELVATLTLSTG